MNNKDIDNNKGDNNNEGENKININNYKAEILDVPNEYNDYDINFKIIVIGNSGVGKTCITNQAIKHQFIDNYMATVGMEIYSLFMRINDKNIKLQIWDTCGQELYRSLISNFYRNSSLAILVYSIDQRDSYKDIDLWVKDIRANSSPDTKIILVGNKIDLEDRREIKYEEGKKIAEDYGFVEFFETSAKTGENVAKMFLNAGIILYDEHLKYKNISTNTSFNTFKPSLTKSKKKNIKKKECC